jgi:hypothetical protein
MKKASIPIVLGLIGISIPFLIRTTFVSYPLQGVNSTYLTIYLYSLDILLFLLWGYLMFITKKLPFSYNNIVDKLWVILFSYIFLRGIFTEYPLISWVYGLRFYLGISIVWYISRLQNWAKSLAFIAQCFVIGMLGQSLIAIMQIILQKNLNLPLVVEPALSSLLAGISKTIINGDVFIRAYGTFPHPNILAFAALMALLIVYTGVFTRKQALLLYALIVFSAGFVDHYLLTSIQAFAITILTGLYIGYGKVVRFPQWFSRLSIGALHTILLLAFSKTALILVIMLDIIYLTVSRNSQLFHVEQFQNNMKTMGRVVWRAFIVGTLLITLIIPYTQIVATISKRIYYIEDAWQIITNNWFWGIGLGQYVASLPDTGRELWQYEPVHNIFLLIWSEIGFVGMVLLITIIILEYYTRIYGYKR